jgi:hypothetical protein
MPEQSIFCGEDFEDSDRNKMLDSGNDNEIASLAINKSISG